MNILVVHNGYKTANVGGEDIAVQKEIAALKQYSDANIYEFHVSNDDIQAFNLVKNIWGNQTYAKDLQNKITQWGIDIVHVHNFFPLLTPLVFKAAKAAGAKVVHTLHNYRWWCLSGTLFRNNQTCEKCLNKKMAVNGILHGCYRNSVVQSAVAGSAFAWYHHQQYLEDIDLFFVLSEFAKTKLKGLIPEAKLKIKPNLIDEPPIPLPLAKDKKDYLYVGRLEQAKGIELLLSIWRTLSSDFHLQIIGTGVDEQKLREAYTASNISFLGKRTHAEVLMAMANSRYLVHPAMAYETFGLTLLEAMSVGTPVIALDVGPRKEFVINEYNGFLTTLASFKHTLETSLHHVHYERFSQNACAFSQNFSAKSIIAKQIGFYQGMS